MDTRSAIGSVDPRILSSVQKIARRDDGAYTVKGAQGQEDVLVEMRPDGGWDLYTAGPPSQLGLWRDTATQQTVKRDGLLGWLGFTKEETRPANSTIEADEVRPLEFLGDNASNKERYREVSLPPAAEPKPWKANHYDISMKFDKQGEVVSIARIQGVGTAAAQTLPLDFSNFASQIQVKTPNGLTDAITMTEHGLLVNHPLAPEQKFDLEVSFRGQPKPVSHPAVPADLGWLTNDASTVTFNGVDRASSWLPGDDNPANKATYDFRVEVPKGHFAVANGKLVNQHETENGSSFHYTSEYPMASYLASVNCFDSKEYTQTEVSPGFEVVHPRGMEEQVQKEFANHPRMMAFLTQRLGSYPFETYGAIVTDLATDTYSSRFTDGQNTFETDLGYQIAFEAQTRPIYPTGAIKGYGDFEETLMHELAHQWFGNAVTKASEQDIWVNEAFPSYSGQLWREEKYGAEVLDSEMEGLHEKLSAHEYQDTMACPDRDKLFSLENYGRMTLSMHALRRTLGDEQFYKTLKGVVDEHKHSSITVDQMVSTADRLNDGKLKGFFDSWLHSKRLPELPKTAL